MRRTIRGISKIVDKVQGKEVEEDVSLVESLVGAGISAGIKIPKGLSYIWNFTL